LIKTFRESDAAVNIPPLCGNGQEELYDHKKDPNEWINLAGNTEYEKTKMQLCKGLMSILK